jgi:ABC-type lipoprotein release transport system permease subunit
MTTFVIICAAVGFAGALLGIAMAPWIALVILTFEKKEKK